MTANENTVLRTESYWQWWYRELLAVVVQRVTGSGGTESYWQW
jgi:hypothetical protein